MKYAKNCLLGILVLSFGIYSSAQWQTKAPNSSNPFDSAGLIHNQAIYNFTSAADHVVSFSVDYVFDIYPDGLIKDSLERCARAAAYDAVHDSTSYVPSYMSSTGRTYAAQLLSHITSMSDTSDLDGTIDDIKELESTILAADMNTSEQRILLQAASVARFSACYWIETTDTIDIASLYKIPGFLNSFQFNSEHMGGPQNFQGSEDSNFHFVYKRKSFWQILAIIGGDIVGALVGGGLVAANNPGSAIAAAGGAMVGAMCASLWVNEIQNHNNPD